MIKISVVGDTGTGKSALVERFLSSTFQENAESAQVEARHRVAVSTADGESIDVEIVDTVNEVLGDSNDMYHKVCDAQVILLVYSIDSVTSYNNLYLTLTQLQNNYRIYSDGKPEPKTLVVATKRDLEEYRQVSLYSDRALFDKFHLSGYTECSSKDGSNVYQVFTQAVELGQEQLALEEKYNNDKQQREGHQIFIKSVRPISDTESAKKTDPEQLPVQREITKASNREVEPPKYRADKSKPEVESGCSCVIT